MLNWIKSRSKSVIIALTTTLLVSMTAGTAIALKPEAAAIVADFSVNAVSALIDSVTAAIGGDKKE